MNDKLKKFIPLLIILFIICLSTFIYLNKDLIFKDKEIKENIDIEDKDEPILEIEDQEDLDNQEDVIVPEEEVKEENNTVPENKEEQNNKVESNTNNTTKPSKPSGSTNNNTNSNNNTNNSTNQDNSESKDEPVEEENTPTPVPTPTQKELNDEYRKKLQSTYSVKIAYGEEMGNYIVAYYTPTKMNDDDTINTYLSRIETELKKYPDGFFKEMSDYGMPLTIYLVKDIPNSSISGFTDSQIYSNIIITIKESTLFETTLNHELMHYIDAYLNSKLYPNSVDVAWNLLNPEGYTYGSFDTNYDYFPSQNNNAYFFTNYAQTNYKEDRATLFGDLMTRVIKRNCYNEGYPLYNKIKLLAEQIDEGFVTVTSSNIEYWEKFL